MFHLSLIQDIIKIHPKYLGKSIQQAVHDEILKLYANKVIENLGLCITIYDIWDLQDPFVHPGDGCPFIKAKFRLVMFRPYIGEVIIGKIKSADEHGIKISLDFFDDIFLPSAYLQPNSVYDTQERLWYWSYQGNRLYMDIGEFIRFRVLAENFVDLPPIHSKEQILGRKSFHDLTTENLSHVSSATVLGNIQGSGLRTNSGTSISSPLIPSSSSSYASSVISSASPSSSRIDIGKMCLNGRRAPYTILVSITEDGLGLLSWWSS